MINQLLDQVYFNPKITEKFWKACGNSDNMCWKTGVYYNLIENISIGNSPYVVFNHEGVRIDSSEKFVSFLNKISLEDLEMTVLDEIFWNISSHNVESHLLFKNISLKDKCEHLNLQWYLSDRNLEIILEYSRSVTKTQHY